MQRSTAQTPGKQDEDVRWDAVKVKVELWDGSRCKNAGCNLPGTDWLRIHGARGALRVAGCKVMVVVIIIIIIIITDVQRVNCGMP